MTDDERASVESAYGGGEWLAETQVQSDPDRLPDLRVGAKLLSLRDVVEIERRKALMRKAAPGTVMAQRSGATP